MLYIWILIVLSSHFCFRFRSFSDLACIQKLEKLTKNIFFVLISFYSAHRSWEYRGITMYKGTIHGDNQRKQRSKMNQFEIKSCLMTEHEFCCFSSETGFVSLLFSVRIYEKMDSACLLCSRDLIYTDISSISRTSCYFCVFLSLSK